MEIVLNVNLCHIYTYTSKPCPSCPVSGYRELQKLLSLEHSVHFTVADFGCPTVAYYSTQMNLCMILMLDMIPWVKNVNFFPPYPLFPYQS